MLTTVITAVVTSAVTTLAYGGAQAWWYRPRPVDPELFAAALGGMAKVAMGTGPCRPHIDGRECPCPPQCTCCSVTPPSES